MKIMYCHTCKSRGTSTCNHAKEELEVKFKCLKCKQFLPNTELQSRFDHIASPCGGNIYKHFIVGIHDKLKKGE